MSTEQDGFTFASSNDNSIDALIAAAERDAQERRDKGITLPNIKQIGHIIDLLQGPQKEPQPSKSKPVKKAKAKKPVPQKVTGETVQLSSNESQKGEQINRLVRTLMGTQEPDLHVHPAWMLGLLHRKIHQGVFQESKMSYESLSGQVHEWGRKHMHDSLNYYGIEHFLESERKIVEWPWFDHWGTITEDKRQYLVTEPYTLSQEDWKSVEQFANLLGLSYYVSGRSWWNPAGGTIRIAFFIPDKK